MTTALARIYEPGIKVHSFAEPWQMVERVRMVGQNEFGVAVIAPRDLEVDDRFKYAATRGDYMAFLGSWLRREGEILSYWIRMTGPRP